MAKLMTLGQVVRDLRMAIRAAAGYAAQDAKPWFVLVNEGNAAGFTLTDDEPTNARQRYYAVGASGAVYRCGPFYKVGPNVRAVERVAL